MRKRKFLHSGSFIVVIALGALAAAAPSCGSGKGRFRTGRAPKPVVLTHAGGVNSPPAPKSTTSPVTIGNDGRPLPGPGTIDPNQSIWGPMPSDGLGGAAPGAEVEGSVSDTVS